jgi:hypothetical protein
VLARKKMQRAIKSLERALKELDQGEKRKAIGSLDHVKDRVEASIHILIAEVTQEEGKF